MGAKILMVLSASIVLALGVIHLVYTFRGTNFTPRDSALQISMTQISPVITKETTMWRCWVGFNASHSMGLILFGLVFGFLALAHDQVLFQSPFLLVVGMAMLGGFVVLCKIYFFSVPLTSEKRLARILLLLAHFGKDGVHETPIPNISQETLAEMIGTTRSRVSFFMNRFRKLGFIDYHAGDALQVHSSLLNIVLHD